MAQATVRPPTKGVQLRLTEEEHRKLRIAAAKRGVAISRFVAAEASRVAGAIELEEQEAAAS